MQGKILKVFNNDLNNKEFDKEIYLLACFNHKKYMNKYTIFTFKQDIIPQELYYGSIFIKNDTLVIFEIKEDLKQVILDFTEEYKNNTLNEFELIDTTNLKKVELVNYNKVEYKDINLIYNISFPIQNIKENQLTKKKSPLSIVIIIVLLLISIGIFLYFYLNNGKKDLNKYFCKLNTYSSTLELNYTREIELEFDKNNILKNNSVTETYKFINEESYYEFKNNNKHYEYFNIDGTYKYNDLEKELKIFYIDKDMATNYEQITSILKRQGYICQEVTDE